MPSSPCYEWLVAAAQAAHAYVVRPGPLPWSTVDRATSGALPGCRIGVVDGDSIEVQGEFELTLAELREAHEGTIPALLA